MIGRCKRKRQPCYQHYVAACSNVWPGSPEILQACKTGEVIPFESIVAHFKCCRAGLSVIQATDVPIITIRRDGAVDRNVNIAKRYSPSRRKKNAR